MHLKGHIPGWRLTTGVRCIVNDGLWNYACFLPIINLDDKYWKTKIRKKIIAMTIFAAREYTIAVGGEDINILYGSLGCETLKC